MAGDISRHVARNQSSNEVVGAAHARARDHCDCFALVRGGLVLPLVWTAVSYGLMGVVNPALQDRVNWFWFIVTQFVFGVTAAVVVLRSEIIHIPPAGPGPDRVAGFVAGEGGGGS